MPDFEPIPSPDPGGVIHIDIQLPGQYEVFDGLDGHVPPDETSDTLYNYTIEVRDDGAPSNVVPTLPHQTPYQEDPNSPPENLLTVFVYDAGKGKTKGKKVNDMPMSPIRDR